LLLMISSSFFAGDIFFSVSSQLSVGFWSLALGLWTLDFDP
jgi:hypothetical protein